MTTKNKTVYIANDGKEFCNEEQCLQYEEKLKEAEQMRNYAEVLQAYCEKNYTPSYYYNDTENTTVCQTNNCPFHYGCGTCQFDTFPIDWEV